MPTQHVSALLVALSASTDNFLVGLSEGLARHSLEPIVLWGIALANAIGGWIACTSGHWVQEFLSAQQQLIAAGIVFGYLAFQEYREWSANITTTSTKPASLALALPMTLNNMAGGVSAGVLGVSPLWNFIYALLISVITMWTGHFIGRSTRRNDLDQHQGKLWSITLYLYLALASFYESARF